MSIIYKVPRTAKWFGLKGLYASSPTRGPETFTSLGVGSCSIINASDVFYFNLHASNNLFRSPPIMALRATPTIECFEDTVTIIDY